MTARFILSLDCEGKWGIADMMNAATHAELSDESLQKAYRGIIGLLDEYDIPATFAFTGCFSLPQAELTRILPELEPFRAEFPHYMGKALEDFTEGSRQGWAGAWSVTMTENAKTKHEIGLHGVTHIPLDDPKMTEAWARRELALAYDLKFPVAQKSTTFIHPRGAVAYTHLLAERGIIGYRDIRHYPSRILSLLSEFNIFSPPDADTKAPLIPAGYFINWWHGGRKLVPVEVSRLRARRMLKAAARTNQVVHYWTHPENIASAPETLEVMRAIIEEVAKLRDRGECEVQTQADYCCRQGFTPPSAAPSRPELAGSLN